MNCFLICVYLLLLCSLCQSGGKSRVVELDESFRVIRYKGKWLVLFFSPWCPNLSELFLYWEDLANNLSITGLRVSTLNTNLNREVSKIIGIYSTPTILFYNNGIEYEYTGRIDRALISRFIESVNGELLTNIIDCSNMSNFVELNPVLFLCVYNGTIITSFQEIYTKAAIGLKHRNKFLFTTNITAFNNSYMNPNIFVYKLSHAYYYEGEHSLGHLAEWIFDEHLESFPQIHLSEMYYIASNCKHKLIAIFIYDENSFLMQLWNNTIFSIAKDRKFHARLLIITTHECTIVEKIIGICPPLPSFIVWNSSNLEYFDLGIFLNDYNIDKFKITITVVEDFLTKVIQKDTIAFSGYSYFFAISAILTDILVGQKSLIYSYPFMTLMSILLLILLSVITCFNIFFDKT